MNIKKNEEGVGAIGAILIIVIVALVGASGWLVYTDHNKVTSSVTTPSTTTTPKTQPTTKTTPPQSSELNYTSKIGSFTVSYPKGWSIEGYTGQGNTTKVPDTQMDGTESSVLLTSSGAKSNSFGVWLTIGDSNSATSSLNSAFTQIPFAQGSVLKSLSNGVVIWEANQSLTINGHTNPDTCTPFETVSDGAFGFKLNNGKYLDASMSFCYAQGQTTTNSYNQQANSSELQQAISIISSLKQN